MKYCSNCGSRNDDANEICQQCGKRLSSVEDVLRNTSSGGESGHDQTFQSGTGSVPAQQGNGPAYIRQIAGSKKFLVAAVLFSAYILFSFIRGTSASSSGYLSSIYQILSGTDYYYVLMPYMDSIINAGTSPFSTFIGLIPSISIAAGLWMIYSSANSQAAPGPRTAGFTILKVMMMITLVAMCVLCGLFDLLLIFLMVVFASDAGAGFVLGMIIMMLIFTAAFLLIIFYYRKILSVIKMSTTAIQTGNFTGKPSMYLIVINIISAVLTVFSLFTSGIWGFLADGSMLAFLIVISILLSNVKKDIELNTAGDRRFLLKNTG